MRVHFQAELKKARDLDVYRRLKKQVNVSPTEAIIDGKRATLFAGNDYLGLSAHPEVIKASVEATLTDGASATASRLITGNHNAYGLLERTLAAFKEKEAALVFPTGYMANLGFLSATAGPRDVIYMDKLNHASLYDGARLSGANLKRYRHSDTESLEKALKSEKSAGNRFIVTDGVFSMDGDLAPLAELKELANVYECMLIVDDAHGTGVLGPNGRGTAEHLGVELSVEIGTLSKGAGSLGGFITGDSTTIDYLINKARTFIFTTGLTPGAVAAGARAIELISEEGWRRVRVLELAARARTVLADAGFKIPTGFTPIVPIIVGEESKAVKLSAVCLEKGIFIPAVRTPTVPKGQARLRMTLSALHTDEELDSALDILIAAGKELDLLA